MKNFFLNNLKVKLITLLILIVTTILTIFEMYDYTIKKREITKELLALSERTINRLSENLILPLWEIDNGWVKKIIDTEMSDNRVYAILVNGEGYLFEAKKRDKNGLIIEFKSEIKGNFIIKTKTIMRENRKIGSVTLYVTKKYMDEELQREILNIFYHTLILSIFIIIFLISILNKTVIYPIKSILNVVKYIAKGDYSKNFKIHQRDEIGMLVSGFNEMKNSIRLRELERDKAIVELSEKEEYLKDILNSQPNIVVVNDGEYLINVNRAFFQFFSEYKSLEEFHKKHKCICELFENDVNEEFLQENNNGKNWIEVIKENPVKTHKVKIDRKDKFYIFSVKLEDVYLKNGHENIVTFSDITELENYKNSLEKRVKEEVQKQRIQEEQLLQQAKLVQMGEMITNISHHWRQPLNLIGLNIQDILDAFDYGELDREYLTENIDQTMDALTQMSKTIDNFRDYLVKKTSQKSFELSNVISKTLNLIAPSLESHYIQVETNLKKELYAFGDETKLIQALHNILLNSQEAFIERKIDKRVITISLDEVDNSWSKIVISDNAGGIEENILDRVFEPFFTTKEIAFKTGTGLYFTKIFIEGELQGDLKVENIKDGLKFIIKLPPPKNI